MKSMIKILKGEYWWGGAIIVYAPAHNKIFADVGMLWKDETGVKFTLLRVLDEDKKYFIPKKKNLLGIR